MESRRRRLRRPRSSACTLQGFPSVRLPPATFLVTGLTEVDLGAHQRFAGPFLFLASVVMALAAVVFGIFSF